MRVLMGSKARWLIAGALLVLLIFPCGSMDAQTVNGALHGTVTDPTGAVVPGAKIVVISLSNRQIRIATTDSKGFYAITELPPARYSVSVSASGFQTTTEPNVQLLVNQDLEADYALRVGQVTQRVRVTAATAMIDTTGATLGHVIGSQQIVNLPLNGRQFTQLMLLTTGAPPIETGQQTGQIISIGGGGISPSMNGQQGTQNNYFLDGFYNNQFFTESYDISPPPDAIQEFNVQSHAVNTQFGISPGADVNIVTKSGGPQIHGDAWEFLRNNALDAAGFFADLSHEPTPPYRQNQFGGTIGGPLVLPGYNGRKKHTYFFGYYEGFRSAESSTMFLNVPTPQEEAGDFSDLLTTTSVTSASGAPLLDALGRPMLQGTIYNPYSTRSASGGVLVRDAFPGNIIPSSLITPEAAVYLHAFYPAPNYGPGGNHFPNYAAPISNDTDANSFGVSLDHTFANNDTLNGHFYYQNVNEVQPNGEKLGASLGHNDGRTATVSYAHIFSPTLLLTANFAYIWSSFGFPAEPAGTTLLNAIHAGGVIPVTEGIAEVPEITLGPRLSGTNQFGNALGPMRTHQFNLGLQKTHGSHTLSAGLPYMHTHAYDNGWGAQYNFDQYASSGIDLSGSNQPSTGDGLAGLLLDVPSSLTEEYGNTAANDWSSLWGVYGQDKWQITRKLNMTAGIRWDYMTPPTYLNNQFSAWNTNCPGVGPIAVGTSVPQSTINSVDESCLFMPVSYTPPRTAALPNPPEWPLPNVRPTVFDPRYNGWEPRLGFAYSLTPKTVIRAGGSVFNDHNQFQQYYQDGRGDWPWGGTATTDDLNRGIANTFWTHLPPTSSYLHTAVVTGEHAEDNRPKIPTTLEYNFGIQQQLAPNLMLSADYVGSEGWHQFGSYAINAPLPSAMGPNAIPYGLPFPFLLSPFQADDDIFNNNYNSLQVSLVKRTSHGLNFLASYTYSKCLDVAEGMWQEYPEDTYNMKADYGPCDYNIPQLFSFSTVYALPFGQGKHFASTVGPLVNAVIGGWNFSDITSARSGSPFSVVDPADIANTGGYQRPNFVPGCQLDPAGFQQTSLAWYNPKCFAEQSLYTYGDLGRNTMRGPDELDFDMSLFKNFKVTESKSLQFRAEFFNIFNRVNFSPPSSTVGAPGFMQIFSAGPARIIQFALKFYF